MRLYGYCTRCRRVKPVRVDGYNGKLPIGVCAECERKRREARS